MTTKIAQSLVNPSDGLERENEKLRVIVEALIRRAEANPDERGTAYAHFARAAMLEDQVRERTRDLERALDLLNMSNAQLAQAHRETDSARQNLASAIETVQEGFALFDSRDILVMCNSRFNALLPDIRQHLVPGLSFSDYLRTVASSSHLGMPAGMTPAEWISMRAMRHSSHHFILTQQMGEDRWVQVSEHRTQDGGTVILQTEVTDLIRRERAERGRILDDQAEILRATLEHLKLGICVFDARLELLAWNGRIADFLTLARTRLRQGMHFDTLLEQVRSQFIFPNGMSAYRLSDWVRRVRRRDHLQLEVSREGGQVYEIFAQELPDGGFVLSLSDITAERAAVMSLSRANETLEARVLARTLELEDALARAERASASRSRFVAAASHDLLQPLSAAKLYLASLGDDALTGSAQVTLAKVSGALGSVEAILGALLDISRLESGRAAVEIGPVPLGPMFRALGDEFAPIAAQKGLVLRIRPTELVMLSDRTYLRRILQNLVSNAVRYTREGRVLLAARRRGAQIRIEVRDSGPGIADEDQELIFREFHRVDAHASASEGMGLGLAIVDRAAALLGHPLSLRSCAGMGSTFALGVPLAVGQIARPDPVGALIEAFGSEEAELLVLLVENDAELSRAMVQLLEKWGATVFDVPSGEEALDLVAATGLEPDLCLIDFQLGEGMDGLQALEALRERLGPVVARIVTADRSEALRARAAAMQAEVINKPIPPAELAALISDLRRIR